MSRQEARINALMEAFNSKSTSEKVVAWHIRKLEQEKHIKKKSQCVICKSLKIPAGLAGAPAIFERHEDGRLTATCGGRDGAPVCPGYDIQRDAYVDQATVTSEIQASMREMRGELKIIRDRVLATETLSKEDAKAFREMSIEYARLKEIEEAHASEIIKESEIPNHVISIEDEILVPSTYFGNTVGLKMVTPMIPVLGRNGNFEPGEFRDMISVAMCKEEIPVRVMIDEPSDDA